MSIIPFHGVDRRSAFLRATLLISCLFGVIASRPLWLNSRSFPLLPIVTGFPVLPSPWDQILFWAMAGSLVLAFWFYRWAVGFFVIAGFLAFCQDENRGQPWFYMYWVMLALTLLPGPAAIAACRFAVSAVYVWGGIQKCNAKFFQVEPARFVAPAANWHLPAFAIDVLRLAVASAPLVEIGIGLALWITGLRRIAIGAVLLVHLSALLFLGPFGSNFNLVIWPWNIAMIGLVLVLFTKGEFWQRSPTLQPESAKRAQTAQSATAKGKSAAERPRQTKPTPVAEIRFSQAFANLRSSKIGLVAVGLFSFLPLLSFAGLWDSYFSFSLYSQSEASANIFVTETFRDRLPEKLRGYVHPFPQAFDPEHQAPYYFGFEAWCYEESHVPPIPEPRNYRAIFAALRAWSKEAGDLRMIMGPRSGQVIFYEGDRYELLVRR